MQKPNLSNRPNRNIELKCRCDDLAAAKRRAEQLGARDMGVLHQRDTFFGAPMARLKLREFGDGRAELISYRRPDAVEARGSDYLIYTVAQPEGLLAVLRHALVPHGTVVKRRHLFLYKNTRIHLDEVEGAGRFVELETVLTGQSDQEGLNELQEVALALSLNPDAGVPVPYVELLHPASK